MPQDFNSIKSMEENELIFENPLYESDVKKREVKTIIKQRERYHYAMRE